MTPSEIKASVKWVTDCRDKADLEGALPFQIVMKSTSRYHEKLLFALHDAGLPACIAEGRLLKRYMGSLPWNSKNDPLDAKGIAHYACCRVTRLWSPFSPNILKLRDLLRARKSLKSKAIRLGNQLHALSHAHYTDKEIERSYRRLVKNINREIKELEVVILKLYRADKKLFDKAEPIIKDVKGFGFLTVITVLAETNGLTSVNSRSQLAKYAGYDVVENSSGKFKGKAHISKRGNKHIRVAMNMAAVGHIQHGVGNIQNAYQRGRERKPDIYKHGNVIVQRKLLLLIYTLWTTGAIYDPHHLPAQCQPKAFSPSIEKESPPEQCPEVHGIAASEEALPILTQL